MDKLTIEMVRSFVGLELDDFDLERLRQKHKIASDSSVFYTSISRLCKEKVIKRVKRGVYKKVTVVQPIKVFGRERRAPIVFNPPKDRDSEDELAFFRDIVFREGDLILLSGFKNKGKTAMCLNLVAENLNLKPVLMGNEYTTQTGEGYEPSPRLLNRLDNMDWVQWVDKSGGERFELLPVYEDYAEQIRPGRLNVIDWVNLTGEYYLISSVMEGIKRAIGRGIGVIVLQKNPGADYGRGGNLSKDFADVELLLDPYGDDLDAVMLTVATVKESTRRVMGRKFAYHIQGGVKIVDFREVMKCPVCYGKGWKGNMPCPNCDKLGYVDKEVK